MNEQVLSFTDLLNKIEKIYLKSPSTETRVAIKEVQALLESYENERNRLTLDIIHEVGSPLSVLRNGLQNLIYWINKFKETEDQDYLERIERYEESFTYALDGLCLYSQWLNAVEGFNLRGPGTSISTEPDRKNKMRPEQVIDWAFTLFRQTLDEKEIDVNINTGVYGPVFGSRENFRTIIHNLTNNSIYWLETSDKKNKRIEISFYSEVDSETGEKAFHMNFMDNGPGISEELLKDQKLFQRNVSERGTHGIGLAIAQRAANQNNWLIEAHEHNEGAWFTVGPFIPTKFD